MSQFEMVLSPNRRDEKSRALALETDQWAAALRYSKLGGYSAPDTGGMPRDAVRSFSQALRAAARAGRVAPEDLGWLDKLLAFLGGDGRGGFGTMRNWRSWKRAMTTK